MVLWLLINPYRHGPADTGKLAECRGGQTLRNRVDRVKMAAFIVSAPGAFLTGVLLSSLVGSGSTTAGDTYLLNAFAAVFLGSATLRDGEFHILGTFIGVLIVGVAFNGLAIFGAPTFYQYIFQGAYSYAR